ncbi:MAG: ABC transporter permease subunit [Lachnospiraceae bacterium]|nr:ABC transporter permease subunit [Lachnospiraceae bacterium]
MKTKAFKLLLKKELLDVFRDKKAIIMMVLVPILLYPLIFFGSMAVMTMIQSNMEEGEYKVAIVASDDGALKSAVEKHNENAKVEAQEKAETESTDQGNSSEDSVSQGNSASTSANGIATDVLTLVDAPSGDYQEALQNEELDAYVTSSKDSSGKTVYEVYYVSSITNSSYAAGIVRDVVDELSREESKEKIQAAGLDADVIMNPVVCESEDLASSEQSAGSILGMILPFLLVLSLLMGTMYPAIDVTAGEKERGTLETLLTLPVSNREIIFSKFFTVAIIGIISALLNIVSIAFMGTYMIRLMGDAVESMGISFAGIDIGKFIPAIIFTVLAILAFSLFISAVTMCITSLAKSYKEANNYITPLMLVVMLTGYIGFIPNIELTHTMALVPVANICLMIKNLLLFKVEYKLVAVVLVSNVLYAIVAVLILSRIYDSENVLFDEGKFSLKLFERRSNMKKGGVPTTGDAWFMVVFVMFAYLYLGSVLEMKYGFGGIFGIQMIIFVLPLLYVLYTKRSILQTYSFRKTKFMNFVAALFMGCGTMLIGIILTSFVSMLFPTEAEMVSSGLMNELMSDNELLTFAVVALTPAVCEEMLFRGFLFSAFRGRYKIVVSVLLTAVIFGVYHMSIVRFFTTALLGAALAVIVYYSDSIFPAMMMHAINNGIAVLQMYHPDTMENIFPLFAVEEPGIMESIVVSTMGILLLAAGVAMFKILQKKKEML